MPACNDPDPEANAGAPVNDGFEPGTAEEYDRLLEERARLIASGVSPDDLLMPLRPKGGDDDGVDSGAQFGQPA